MVAFLNGEFTPSRVQLSGWHEFTSDDRTVKRLMADKTIT